MAFSDCRPRIGRRSRRPESPNVTLCGAASPSLVPLRRLESLLSRRQHHRMIRHGGIRRLRPPPESGRNSRLTNHGGWSPRYRKESSGNAEDQAEIEPSSHEDTCAGEHDDDVSPRSMSTRHQQKHDCCDENNHALHIPGGCEDGLAKIGLRWAESFPPGPLQTARNALRIALRRRSASGERRIIIGSEPFEVTGRKGFKADTESDARHEATREYNALGTSESPGSDHPADGRPHGDARGRPRVLPRADAQDRDSA